MNVFSINPESFDLTDKTVPKELKRRCKLLMLFQGFVVDEDSKNRVMEAIFQGVTHHVDRGIITNFINGTREINLYLVLRDILPLLHNYKSFAFISNLAHEVDVEDIQKELMAAGKSDGIKRLMKQISPFQTPNQRKEKQAKAKINMSSKEIKEELK